MSTKTFLAGLAMAAAGFLGMFSTLPRDVQKNMTDSIRLAAVTNISISETDYKKSWAALRDAQERKRELQKWETKVSKIINVSPTIFPKIMYGQELPNKDLLLKSELAEPLKKELKDIYDAVFADFATLSDVHKKIHSSAFANEETVERLFGATMKLMEFLLKRIKLYEMTLFSDN